MDIKRISIAGAIIAAVALIGGVANAQVGAYGSAQGEATMCTMDAMQCPDGHWVGRSGPNCEFVCNGNPSIPSPAPDQIAPPVGTVDPGNPIIEGSGYVGVSVDDGSNDCCREIPIGTVDPRNPIIRDLDYTVSIDGAVADDSDSPISNLFDVRSWFGSDGDADDANAPTLYAESNADVEAGFFGRILAIFHSLFAFGW